MSLRFSSFLRSLCVACVCGALVACAVVTTPEVRRNPTPTPNNNGAVQADAASSAVDAIPQARLHRGNGQVINRSAAAAPAPTLGTTTTNGTATFNFEGEALQVVVKAILGDLLGQGFTIAPDVQGTVTLNTPKPVSPAQALSLLQQVLAENGARMTWADGRYSITKLDAPLAGSLAPRTGDASGARGYEVRVVPLHYIAASEMKKVLEPYARTNAIIAVDSARNLITLAGTRSELENYLRTVQIFDVDWLAGMSVGVFPLQSGRAGKVVTDLEKVFGEQSGTPSAGMFRFMPLEGANAVLVITPQPQYLDEIQEWLDRIDGASDALRLYSYELKYVDARDLAQRLGEVFGNAGNAGSNASLAPGAESVQMQDSGLDGNDSSVGFGTSAGASAGSSTSSGSPSLNKRGSGNGGSATLQVEGGQVGVSAVEETNSLLVRANAAAWKSIKQVIEQLDVMPLQVHIEAQVASVQLTGELSYGVDWYFENAVQSATDAAGNALNLPNAAGRKIWGDIAGSVTGASGLGWTFLGHNAAAVVSALDQVTNVRMLQTPSIFVRNNAEAMLNVGERIPVSSVTVNASTSSNSYSQVQYLDTGVILKVRPRVTRDGMVFLDIVQEISAPEGSADANGNYSIRSQKVHTEAAVHEGDTILLAGLINDSSSRTKSGLPLLSRLPIIGGLFGSQDRSDSRSETIILLTPTIVRDPQQARDLTDEYSRRFKAMAPLRSGDDVTKP